MTELKVRPDSGLAPSAFGASKLTLPSLPSGFEPGGL